MMRFVPLQHEYAQLLLVIETQRRRCFHSRRVGAFLGDHASSRPALSYNELFGDLHRKSRPRRRGGVASGTRKADTLVDVGLVRGAGDRDVRA